MTRAKELCTAAIPLRSLFAEPQWNGIQDQMSTIC